MKSQTCTSVVPYKDLMVWDETAKFPTLMSYIDSPFTNMDKSLPEYELLAELVDVEHARFVKSNPLEPVVAMCSGPGLFYFTEYWQAMDLNARMFCVVHEAVHQISGEGYHTDAFYATLNPLLVEFDIPVSAAEEVEPSYYRWGKGRYELRKLKVDSLGGTNEKVSKAPGIQASQLRFSLQDS